MKINEKKQKTGSKVDESIDERSIEDRKLTETVGSNRSTGKYPRIKLVDTLSFGGINLEDEKSKQG